MSWTKYFNPFYYIKGAIKLVTSIFVPIRRMDDSVSGSYSEQSPLYEFAGFRNIHSNHLPSALIWTEDGIRVSTKMLWSSGQGTTQARLLEIGAGELESVDGLELDGKTNQDGASYDIYRGTSTQGIDSRYSDSLSLIGGLRDTAYIAITMDSMITTGGTSYGAATAAFEAHSYEEREQIEDTYPGGREGWIRDKMARNPSVQTPTGLSGDPLVTVNIAKGLKIPRWNGTDWTTLAMAASGNPAAVIRSYLLLDRDQGGVGMPTAMIDDASFGEVYEWAEVMVSDGAGGTEPRARVTYALDSFKTWTSVLEDILMSFGGYVVVDGGVIKLRVRKTESPVQDYEHGKLRGSILPESLSYSTYSKQEQPNRLVGIYKDTTEAGNDAWTRTPALDDYADQQSNPRGVVLKEITYRALTRQSQVIRQLTQLLNDYRVNWYGCKFKTDIDSAPRERGDVIRIKHPILGDGTSWHEFCIERIVEYPDHTREIVCKAYNGSIYNDLLAVNPVDLEYVKVPNPNEAPGEVSGLTLSEYGGFANADGTWFVGIRSTFTPPVHTLNIARYRVLVKEESGSYEFVKYVSKLETAFNLGITAEVGKSYMVMVQTESDRDILSDGVESNQVVIVGKDSPPSQVTGQSGIATSTDITHRWDRVLDRDLAGYNLYEGAVFESAVLVAGNISTEQYVQDVFRNGQHVYWITAVDTAGNESIASPYSVDVTTAPLNTISIDISQDLIKDALDLTNIAIEYISVDGYVGTIPALTMDTQLQWDDITDFEGAPWDFPVTGSASIQTGVFDLGGIGTGQIVLDLKAVMTGEVGVVKEINTSNDGVTWNGWQVFTVANYSCRYFKFKFTLTSNDISTGTIHIYKAGVTFDVIDSIQEATVTITDAINGIDVVYVTPFNGIPISREGTLELYDADTEKFLMGKAFNESGTGFNLKTTNIQTGQLDTGTIRYKARSYILTV